MLGHFNHTSHIFFSKQELVKNMPDLIEVAQVYEACQQGKLTKLPFPKNQAQRASKRVQLIHIDVYGPMGTKSLNDNKYFVLFVDDCNWICWTYFIKLNSEVPFVFKNFKTLVENKSGKALKTLRLENVSELISNLFTIAKLWALNNS